MSRRDAELEEEMREHLARLTEQNLAAGMTRAEARRAAHLQFGHTEGLKEAIRSQRPLAWLADTGGCRERGARPPPLR
jgi:hypothetical protein